MSIVTFLSLNMTTYLEIFTPPTAKSTMTAAPRHYQQHLQISTAALLTDPALPLCAYSHLLAPYQHNIAWGCKGKSTELKKHNGFSMMAPYNLPLISRNTRMAHKIIVLGSELLLDPSSRSDNSVFQATQAII